MCFQRTRDISWGRGGGNGNCARTAKCIGKCSKCWATKTKQRHPFIIKPVLVEPNSTSERTPRRCVLHLEIPRNRRADLAGRSSESTLSDKHQWCAARCCGRSTRFSKQSSQSLLRKRNALGRAETETKNEA